MKIRQILTAILLCLFQDTFTQTRFDSLKGSWRLICYQSPSTDNTIDRGGNGCADFLTLKVNSKGKIKFIFTEKADTIKFSGRIKTTRDKRIKINNNIHEIVYLYELEKCITPMLRIDLRKILFRTYDFSIQKDTLTFFYDLPRRPTCIRTMTFVRRKD